MDLSKFIILLTTILSYHVVYTQQYQDEVCTSLSSLSTQLCTGQVNNNRYSHTNQRTQGLPGKRGPKGDRGLKGESSTYFANEEKNRRFASKIAALHKQLTTVQGLTEENIGVKQELNETKILLTDLTEENIGVKQELNETKILLTELTEENIGIKQELNETKQFLVDLTEENIGVKQELNETKILLIELTEENNGIKQELNETKQSLVELTEENIGVKQELNETKILLTAVKRKFEDYQAETDSILSELICSMKVPKSCEGVTKCQNTPRNGTYSIQPDPSLPAFDVECSFNGNTATTSVGHNSEMEIEMSKCQNPKCYGRNIVYDATIPQIRALISLSGSCRQYIKYRCFESNMELHSSKSGWESWDGSFRNYWGGSGGRNDYCACGVTGTCANTNQKCNCEKNDKVWREDEGYLEMNEHLPVTKLYFEDNDDEAEHGLHTLGKLECVE